MRLRRDTGVILLGVWLILTGLLPFLNITIPYVGLALSALAIIAGVMLLARPANLQLRKRTGKFGILLLGVWLILSALIPYLTLPGVPLPVMASTLALVSGILIVIGR